MEQRFRKLLNLEPDIQEGDETIMANNPRNWLADKVNPVIEEYLPESMQFAIPKMTVADEKRYQAELPENMAGMGTARFGKLLPKENFGKVTVIPSAADKISDAQKAQMAQNTAIRRYQKEFIDTGVAEQIKKTLSPEEFKQWTTDTINRLIRGE